MDTIQYALSDPSNSAGEHELFDGRDVYYMVDRYGEKLVQDNIHIAFIRCLTLSEKFVFPQLFRTFYDTLY